MHLKCSESTNHLGVVVSKVTRLYGLVNLVVAPRPHPHVTVGVESEESASTRGVLGILTSHSLGFGLRIAVCAAVLV